jgi:hypothetical protein
VAGRLAQVAADAPRLARSALQVLRQAYPHKLDHLILDAADRPLPADIHPVFDGCYDWHSSVHMHWSLLRLCRLAPALPDLPDVEAHFARRFTPANVARELAYASAARRAGFERPYGWAWLLKLQTELERQAAGGAALRGTARWSQALRPLADFFAQRLADFVGRSHYPVRAGTHANSAFAMLLALEHARAAGDAALQAALTASAQRWFGADTNYPALYEPSGSDFLSPGLCEAVLMLRVLGAGFADWWDRFAPAREAMARWLDPTPVADRTDAQLVHLDGLNLSRAWCLQALAQALPQHAADFAAAADRHWQAAWPHVFGGDFVATHWLLSFALLSVDEG